jgi:hypothetical protein
MNFLRAIIVSLLFALTLTASAQKSDKQTIVLIDGTCIVGIIVADSGDYFRVKIKRPQVITLRKSEIYFSGKAKPEAISNVDKRGYSIRLSTSVLAGRNSDGKVGSMSFHLSNGYQFRNGLSAGFGTGIEELDVQLIPVYADLRFQPLKTRVSPFVWAKTGYGFPLGDQATGDYYYYGNSPESKGGMIFNAGTGIALYSWKRNAVNIGVGYRYQRLSFRQMNIWGGESNKEIVRHFNRVEVQFGFIFR